MIVTMLFRVKLSTILETRDWYWPPKLGNLAILLADDLVFMPNQDEAHRGILTAPITPGPLAYLRYWVMSFIWSVFSPVIMLALSFQL